MKYTEQTPPSVCMMTQSTCYNNSTQGIPVGVLWHDTAAGNPNLWRYVQPDDNAKNKDIQLKKIGVNSRHNDYNHKTVYAGLNCWIGRLADGTVSTIQTLPWNLRPWGCGAGSRGSCNGSTGSPFWIQFEICDDNYTSKAYFNEIYQEACELTAYLCKKFNIDPNGTVNYKNQQVPTILCHQDSYKYQLGSNHSDIYKWFSRYGKDMNTARADITKILNTIPIITPRVDNLEAGDLVSIALGAVYYSGKPVPDWVQKQNWYIASLKEDRAVLGENENRTNTITSPINTKFLTEIFKPYVVRILYDTAVYKEPNPLSLIRTSLKAKDAYTIIEEKDGWGKLKSGAGWINLAYTEKIKK